jgi:hypothetical protein
LIQRASRVFAMFTALAILTSACGASAPQPTESYSGRLGLEVIVITHGEDFVSLVPALVFHFAAVEAHAKSSRT